MGKLEPPPVRTTGHRSNAPGLIVAAVILGGVAVVLVRKSKAPVPVMNEKTSTRAIAKPEPAAAGVTPTESSWPKEPTSYKSVPWGASLDQAREKTVLVVGDCIGNNQKMGCPGTGIQLPLAEVKDTFWFDDDKFSGVRFSFPSEAFDSVKAMFVQRYGSPAASQKQVVSNRMNAQFENETDYWRGPNVTFVVSRYGDTITDGTGALMLNSSLDSVTKNNDAAVKKAAESF